MNGIWVLIIEFLIGVIFLVKSRAVTDVLTRVSRQPRHIQGVVLAITILASIQAFEKSTNETERVTFEQTFEQPAVPSSASSLILQTSSLPDFWKDDPTDTDEDGIPDLWEKWTHGNRAIADSDLDRDDDGLTDLEEFWNQTDPRTADTDGDGFSDYFEVSNGMNPLVQADFTPIEPDTNNNGLPDIWEQAGYYGSFHDANGNGFDDIYETYELPTASDSNFDVLVDVYTSRSALLTWTNEEGSGGIVILPTTGTSIKLRLPFRMHTQLKLNCAPNSEMYASSPSQMEMTALASAGDEDLQLWKAQIKAKYAAKHNPDGDFLEDGDGSFVELVQPQSSVIEALPSDIGSSTAVCGIFIENHSCSVSSLIASGCSAHSGPLMFWCDKTEADHVVSYSWSSAPAGVYGSGKTNFVSLGNLDVGTYNVKCTVKCKHSWWNTSRTTYSIASLNVYDCSSSPDILSVYENEWHIPTNSPAECGTSELVYIGFDHAKVKTRNLSRITVANIDEDITEHCLGVVWADKGEIDLFSLLADNYLPYKNDLQFSTTACTINDDGCLVYGKNPGDYAPDACLVKVIHSPTSLTLDHLWIVINSSTAETEFTTWLSANMNLAWTLALPRPFSSIGIVSNVPQDPEPGNPNEWSPPVSVNSYLHHDATFEARTDPGISGIHGHQAAYSSTGVIITSTIAAGTADFRKPRITIGGITVVNGTAHRDADVVPFVLALQLDGNPVEPRNIWRTLNRPCIYQGAHSDSYISLRPVVPSGTQNRGN